MKLIVGLGNPGPEYVNTRHNVGFIAIDAIAEQLGAEPWTLAKAFKGTLTETRIQGEKVLLLKPQTYMNLSGESVALVANYYDISAEDVLVIFDEVDVPTGELRIRKEGSAGTHNGMKSIVQHLGSTAFPRVRIGIAPAESFRGSLSDYVLGRLTEDELAALAQRMDDILDTARLWSNGQLEEAMNKYNQRLSQ